MPALIEVRRLARVFLRGTNTVHALRGVDLSVARGEFVAVQGRSGSGKSTLLQLLGTLDRPSEGTCAFDGIDVGALSDRALARLRATRIGFVFQTFHLLPSLDLVGNVALPFEYRSEPRREARRRAAAALERVGLGHRLEHTPGALSGGEMQRAAIARALAIEPDLLLADEPTGNLDRHTGEEVMDLVTELHRNGVTIGHVTHDNGVAARADRVLRMLDGRFTGESEGGT